jgi:hypothetical protein
VSLGIGVIFVQYTLISGKRFVKLVQPPEMIGAVE